MQALGLYFRFLTFSLSPSATFTPDFQLIDWEELYYFAEKQALLGVLFEGIKKLPEGIHINEELLLRWAGKAELIKRQNRKTFSASGEASRFFFDNGIKCCILKGQGNAIMYPSP